MRAASLLALGLLAALPAAAQPWTGSAGVGVQVSSRGKPVTGARVELRYRDAGPGPGPRALLTDERGRAAFGGLAAGAWSLEISHPEHLTYVGALLLQPGKKPEETASFLQATGTGRQPIRVKYLKADGTIGRPAPLLEAPERAAEPAPETAPPAAPATEPRPRPEPPEPEPVEPAPQPPEPVEPPPAPAPPPVEPPVPDAAPAPRPAPKTERPAAPPKPAPPPAPPVEAPPSAVAPPPAEVVPAEDAAATPAPAEIAPPARPEPEAGPAPLPRPAAPPEPEPMAPPVPEPAPEPAIPASEPTTPPPPAAPAAEPAEPPLPEPPEAPAPEPAVAVPAPPAEEPPAPLSPPQPEPPAAVEPVAPVPAPAVASPTLRAFRDRSCAECKPGEWSAAAEEAVAPAPAGAGGCGPLAEEGARASALALADSPGPGAFAGPALGGPAPTALDLAGDEAASRASEAIAGVGRPGCGVLAVALPPGARFTGYRYEAMDADGAGDCVGDQACSIGDSRWTSNPGIARGAERIVIYGLFENLSPRRERRARLTAYFVPASGWDAPGR